MVQPGEEFGVHGELGGPWVWGLRFQGGRRGPALGRSAGLGRSRTETCLFFPLPPCAPADGAPGETPRLLSPALFRARVVPVLLRLFEVHEEHVRLVLLTHLEAYAAHFTREQLRTIVLPQVSAGGQAGGHWPERLRRDSRAGAGLLLHRKARPLHWRRRAQRGRIPGLSHLWAPERASPGEAA